MSIRASACQTSLTLKSRLLQLTPLPKAQPSKKKEELFALISGIGNY